MIKKKSLIVLIISVIIIFIVTIINSNKESSIEQSIINSNESKFFNYDYSVNINSNKDNPNYISINFIIDITPKIDGEFKNIIATAYINDEVQKDIAVKSYNTFGVAENEPLYMDRNNSDNKGISIARGTWLYKDTNLDKLIENLNLGIDLEVTWDNGSEKVHITDVNITKS